MCTLQETIIHANPCSKQIPQQCILSQAKQKVRIHWRMVNPRSKNLLLLQLEFPPLLPTTLCCRHQKPTSHELTPLIRSENPNCERKQSLCYSKYLGVSVVTPKRVNTLFASEEEADTSSDHLTLLMKPPSTTTMAKTTQQGKNPGIKAAEKLLINPFNSARICIFFSKFVQQFTAFKSGIFLCFINQELSTLLPHLEIYQLSIEAQDDENKRIKYIFSLSFFFLFFFLRWQVRT